MADKNKRTSGMKITINNVSIGIVLLVIAGIVLYFQFGDRVNSTTVKVGDIVAVDYVGTFENGTVFDTSKELVAIQSNIFDPKRDYAPLKFTVGSGELIKGFDDAVVGMKAGDTKKITLQPKDAYGDVNPDLIIIVNASKIETDKTLSVGSTVIASNGVRGTITEFKNGNATIDFNHPLAGNVLKFEITLVDISR